MHLLIIFLNKQIYNISNFYILLFNLNLVRNGPVAKIPRSVELYIYRKVDINHN